MVHVGITTLFIHYRGGILNWTLIEHFGYSAVS
uniref:Uncharacterized protein n=1 Tax=Anguilla anguilla TaxID=7936 RepID=A0A0E9VBJ7_ANGAN